MLDVDISLRVVVIRFGNIAVQFVQEYMKRKLNIEHK